MFGFVMHRRSSSKVVVARLWELRAAVSLGGLSHSKGRNEDALTLLRPIYGWLTTAERTRDLEEAGNYLADCKSLRIDAPVIRNQPCWRRECQSMLVDV